MDNQPQIPPQFSSDGSFGIVMRGYDRRQVDDFISRSRQKIRDLEARLSRVTGESERLNAELAAAAAARSQAGAPKPAHEELSERMATILRLAEEEADQKRAGADEAVLRIRREAERAAEQLRGEAVEEADHTLSRAHEEAERVIAMATERAEQEVHGAHQEAEARLSSSREEADRALLEARGRAEQLLTDAERRSTAINDGASQRLAGMSQTHEETVDRLTRIREIVGGLLDDEAARGSLHDTVQALVGVAAERDGGGPTDPTDPQHPEPPARPQGGTGGSADPVPPEVSAEGSVAVQPETAESYLVVDLRDAEGGVEGDDDQEDGESHEQSAPGPTSATGRPDPEGRRRRSAQRRAAEPDAGIDLLRSLITRS